MYDFCITNRTKIFNKAIKAFSANLKLVGGRENVLKFKKEQNDEYDNLQISNNINTIANNGDIYFIGFQDGKVFKFDYDKLNDENYSGEFMFTHNDNVCSMDSNEKYLATGSWDHNCFIYDLQSNLYCNLFNHPASVWAVKMFYAEDTLHIVTGCADGVIRIFKYIPNKSINIVKMLEYHNYPVRSLVLHDDYLYSVDNEGFVYKFNMNGTVCNIRNTQNMTYSMVIHKIDGKEYIVTGGETGAITVMDLNLRIVNRCKFKSVDSIWILRSVNNMLVSGCSDGFIYFVSDKGEKLEVFDPFDKSLEEEKEKNVKDQMFSANGVNYKVENGQVFEQNGESWKLIGQANNKYDYIFNVELGQKTYQIAFNKKDNFYEVAAKFIEENKLDKSFQDQIVDFLNKNCRENAFKMLENINIEGIRKVLSVDEDEELVVPLLDELQMILLNKKHVVSRSFEDNLFKLKKKFVIIDIVRFLIAKGVYVDLKFIFVDKIETHKEAIAFANLAGNLMKNLPCKLHKIDKIIRSLLDSGKLKSSNVDFYTTNKELRIRMDG